MADTMRRAASAAPRALLALVLALAMCPMPGYADEAEAPAAQDGAAADAAPGDDVPSDVPAAPDGGASAPGGPSASEPAEGDGASSNTGDPVLIPVPVGRSLAYSGEWQLGIEPFEGGPSRAPTASRAISMPMRAAIRPMRASTSASCAWTRAMPGRTARAMTPS